MQKLNLPEYPFKIVLKNQKPQIFDSIRKKYVALTPEEWVRQHFVQFLVDHKNVPASLIGVEKSIKYNTMARRVDLLVHGSFGEPLMVVECKAPDVAVSPSVFEQIARYNMTLKVNYLIVTNGLSNYCCYIDHEKKSYRFLEEIPLYTNLVLNPTF